MVFSLISDAFTLSEGVAFITQKNNTGQTCPVSKMYLKLINAKSKYLIISVLSQIPFSHLASPFYYLIISPQIKHLPNQYSLQFLQL